jgi:hypothetical protein
VDGRDTPTLFIELVDVDRASYLTNRARQVLDSPTVSRLTCWENLAPDRDDLPRRLDEFTWLAVYEADVGFAPPPRADEVTSLHFVRTARPGQGRLTPEPTKGLLLVLISPRRASDARPLRDWADFVHIRHIAEASVPGYTMITPYHSADGSEPRFLHFYEMNTPDAEKAFKAMTPQVAEMLGGDESERFRAWAHHPALMIDYVSTFTLADAIEGQAD